MPEKPGKSSFAQIGAHSDFFSIHRILYGFIFDHDFSHPIVWRRLMSSHYAHLIRRRKNVGPRTKNKNSIRRLSRGFCKMKKKKVRGGSLLGGGVQMGHFGHLCIFLTFFDPPVLWFGYVQIGLKMRLLKEL